MRSIAEQLRVAFENSGWTVAELLAKSGLKCRRSALQRKLTGHLKFRTEEAEAIATALGVNLVFMPSPSETAA